MLQYVATALSLASAACAAVTTVTVGQGGFVFTPNSITAADGDVVNFKFTGSPGNHTVSQSSFADPCSQLSSGFDSGFVPVASGFSGTPTEWNLTVTNASAPIWFYCKQTNPGPHCISGMVGAINAPTSGSNTLANFVSAAKALSSFPTQTSGSLSGVGASASASPAVPGSAAASGTSSGASASGTAPTSASASATQSGAAFKTSTGSLWTLLAGVLGIIIA